MSAMSSKAKPEKACRVHRGPPPLSPRPITRKKYRKVLRELIRDFGKRCAYCMRYLELEKDIQVDHFDPRRKNDHIQRYGNLFPADARCNRAKGDTWPTAAQRAKGLRFLNCCEEVDYGEVIFEAPETHLLVGTTPAARYHIETIQLNWWELVRMRKERAQRIAILDEAKELERTNPDAVADPNIRRMMDLAQEIVDRSIPSIPPPPPGESDESPGSAH